ncbi:hypothetical protein I350_00411 [Cryptococcus amylolentus CBS 6273]|uniref:Uncharacterized protein n=1 Tax=Cryptococcus amylolentus CBS 6273 TaxID=1296118 RepID=A0A1E3KGC2_9TREE|nr:hypothetical protein I350_00411 [Cryptococcus amylolentus CBS 6273]
MAPGYSYLPKLDLKDISVEAAAFGQLKPASNKVSDHSVQAGQATDSSSPSSQSSDSIRSSSSSEPDTPASTTNLLANENNMPQQMNSLQRALTEAQKEKNKLAQRLGQERKRNRYLLLRIQGDRIDPAVITLLACRLAEHGGKETDQSNGVAEVAAALIDEVDRAKVCGDGKDGQMVVVEDDVEAARRDWNEGKEMRIWNLEGVVQVMFSRVDSLELEVSKLKRERGRETSLGMSWTEDMEWDEEQETLELVESTASQLSRRLDRLESDVSTLKE